MLCLVAVNVKLLTTLWTIAHQAPLSIGILQARMLEWVVMPSSRGSSQHRDRTQISHIEGRFFTLWATRGVLGKSNRSSLVQASEAEELSRPLTLLLTYLATALTTAAGVSHTCCECQKRDTIDR